MSQQDHEELIIERPDMCHAVVCKTCGKTTWRGCGMHVQQVMAGVSQENRCAGHPKQRAGWLNRLRGHG